MKNEKGLALIEWIVIAAIFSILAIVLAPQYSEYKARGLDDQAIMIGPQYSEYETAAQATSVLEDLVMTQALYFRDHSEYTDNWDALAEYGWQRTEGVDVTVNVSIGRKNYMMEASHIDSDNTYRVTNTKRKAVALKQ